MGEAEPGSAYLSVAPDLILGHEATIALLIDRLRKAGRRVHAPERCFFAADHFVPPATAERAGILRKYLNFIKEEGIPTDLLFRGISHQLLIEDPRCGPGALICGADSHTTMGGATGAFSAGFGSTDILALLATGRIFVRVPEATCVRITGPVPHAVTGKDLALAMMRHFGEGGASYRALEFTDETGGQVSMAARATLTNMAVDCGAKNGLFTPDQVTAEYLTRRDGKPPEPSTLERWGAPGPEAYSDELVIAADRLGPLVARPGSPADVIPAEHAEAEPVDQVFIGSCCGGRLEDLAQAAEVLRGRTVRPTVRLVITPASQRVYQAAIASGLAAELLAAGAMITASSCGACGGIDKGILAEGEVCVSTSNRNFRGRMGHNDARIWLASARTAAAAAVAGHVIDPRELMGDLP